MALNLSEREKLENMNIPSETEIRAMLDRFQENSGCTATEISLMTGYSRSSISVFKGGYYNDRVNKDEGNSAKIRLAIKQMIDQHPSTEVQDRQGDVYRDPIYKQMRKAFFSALDHGHAYCVDGAPGTRKSFILRSLCRELTEMDANKNGHGRRAMYVYCAQDITPPELLRRIAEAADIPSRGSRAQLLKKLRYFLSSRRCVVALDEVQHLDVACIEAVRELFDQPPFFGFIFAGSHAVQDLFNSLKLEQARQRLSRTIVLQGLSREDVEDIFFAEFGKRPPQRTIDDVIKNATVIDYRRTMEARRDDKKAPAVTYISARTVWFAIDHMKEQLSTKGATA